MEHDNGVNLRIVNITDCYTLENFPSLKTLVNTKREEVSPNLSSKFATILTGDFLAPYLLSSIDKGTSMIDVLNATPVDYVIFGNHEDDIETKYVNQRIIDYQGKWINTNMQDHAMFNRQVLLDHSLHISLIFSTLTKSSNLLVLMDLSRNELVSLESYRTQRVYTAKMRLVELR
jgi:2',3'-cyclic-nucleotide 2'-phosphodiesterase (5'-nucleotidase family)